MMRSLRVINHRHPAATSRNNLPHRRQRKPLVILQTQFTAPRIKQLHRRRPRRNLRLQISNRRRRNLLQQHFKRPRLLPHQRLDSRKPLFRPPLDHVTRQRPRSPSKSQHRHRRPDFPYDSPNRLHQESRITRRVKNSQRLNVPLGPYRRWQIRPRVSQLQLHPHSFRRNQNVRKHDDRVHAQPPKRLQRNLHGQLRRLAHFQKRPLRPNLAILRQISPRLPHHPHRQTRHRLAAARAQKQLFPAHRSVRNVHVLIRRGLSKNNKSSPSLPGTAQFLSERPVAVTACPALNSPYRNVRPAAAFVRSPRAWAIL